MFWKIKTEVPPKLEIKYCEDCKFCKPFLNNGYSTERESLDLAKCSRPDLNVLTPKFCTTKFCKIERNNKCGLEAKYYEPKLSS